MQKKEVTMYEIVKELNRLLRPIKGSLTMNQAYEQVELLCSEYLNSLGLRWSAYTAILAQNYPDETQYRILLGYSVLEYKISWETPIRPESKIKRVYFIQPEFDKSLKEYVHALCNERFILMIRSAAEAFAKATHKAKELKEVYKGLEQQYRKFEKEKI